jgi:hypothetical protein
LDDAVSISATQSSVHRDGVVGVVLQVGYLPFLGKLAASRVAGDEHNPIATFVPGTLVGLEQREARH